MYSHDILIPVSFHPNSFCPLKTDTPTQRRPVSFFHPVNQTLHYSMMDLIIKGTVNKKNP